MRFRTPRVEKLEQRGDSQRLLRALEYDDGSVGVPVRVQVVAALGRMDAPGVHDGLVRALGDPDESVRVAAIDALRARGGHATVEPLSAAVAGWTAPEDAGPRERAVAALEGMRDADVPLRLAGALIARDEDLDERDRDVLRRLATATDERRGIDLTISYLLSVIGDEARSARTGEMLVWLAPQSVPPLIAALREPPKSAQAARTLGRIRDQTAVEPLCEQLLGSPDPAVRAAAARSLGEIRDPVAIEALLLAMSDADYDVRVAAGTGLDAFGNGGMALALSTLLRPALESGDSSEELGQGDVTVLGEVPKNWLSEVQPQPEPEPEPTPEPEPEPVPERETVATNVTPPAPEEDAGEPAASRQNLVSLDVDGLAEVYDIALEAWHSGERRGQTEKADHWRSVAAAVIDEMLAREGTGRGFDGPLPRAGGVLRRRRSRLRTQLSEACAESAQSRRADAL